MLRRLFPPTIIPTGVPTVSPAAKHLPGLNHTHRQLSTSASHFLTPCHLLLSPSSNKRALSSFPNPQFKLQINSRIRIRTMASTAVAKKEFLCILPDKEGVVAKRIEVRGQHLENVKPLVEAGTVVVGGAMFDQHPIEGETPSFKGSMLMIVAEDADKALEIIKGDIYTRSGVWDLEKAQIIPFKSAARVAL